MGKWRTAKEGDYKELSWVDCTAGLVCKCGYEFTLDEQSGPTPWTVCLNCGTKWRLISRIELADALPEEIAEAHEWQSMSKAEVMQRLTREWLAHEAAKGSDGTG